MTVSWIFILIIALSSSIYCAPIDTESLLKTLAMEAPPSSRSPYKFLVNNPLGTTTENPAETTTEEYIPVIYHEAVGFYVNRPNPTNAITSTQIIPVQCCDWVEKNDIYRCKPKPCDYY